MCADWMNQNEGICVYFVNDAPFDKVVTTMPPHHKARSIAASICARKRAQSIQIRNQRSRTRAGRSANSVAAGGEVTRADARRAAETAEALATAELATALQALAMALKGVGADASGSLVFVAADGPLRDAALAVIRDCRALRVAVVRPAEAIVIARAAGVTP